MLGDISTGRTDVPANAEVFISYSRADDRQAQQLHADLRAHGFTPYLDKHDILPGEPWQERLSGLIGAADTVVFLISPSALASKTCDWEVNEAERLSKRILPVVIHDAPDDQVPQRLKRLNYLFLRNEQEWQAELPNLANAIRSDIGWIREHSRLGDLAMEWARQNRPDDLTLRGHTLDDAEHWLAEQPPPTLAPTALHREFVQESRKAEFERLALKEAEIATARFRHATISHGLTLLSIPMSYLAIATVGFYWPEFLSGMVGFSREVKAWVTSPFPPKYAIWLELLVEERSLLFFQMFAAIRLTISFVWWLFTRKDPSSQPPRRAQT